MDGVARICRKCQAALVACRCCTPEQYAFRVMMFPEEFSAAEQQLVENIHAEHAKKATA